jgi:hypothetical protein
MEHVCETDLPGGENCSTATQKNMWRTEIKARVKLRTITADSKLAGGRRRGVRVRKQVYELTLDDLSTFPVWEFRLDEEGEEGRDESTVRPYTAPGPLDPADRMFVVRAIFTLADGSKPQHTTPPGPGEASIGALQPIVITGRGQVRFCGTALDPKRLATTTSCRERCEARISSAVRVRRGAGRRSSHRQRARFPGAGGFSIPEDEDSNMTPGESFRTQHL